MTDRIEFPEITILAYIEVVRGVPFITWLIVAFVMLPALGMLTVQMTVFITLPQSLRAVIPTQTQPVNFLGSIKETLIIAAVIYWIFTFTTSRVSLRLEKKLGVGER